MIATLVQIAGVFGLLSLLAFGGGAAVLPDMQRAAVEVHRWVTAREFLDMFAISRTIPPGSMIVVLIGQKAAGVAGGLVALLAMFGPSSILAFAVGRLWHRRGRLQLGGRRRSARGSDRAGGRSGARRWNRRWRRSRLASRSPAASPSPAAPSKAGRPTRSPPGQLCCSRSPGYIRWR